MDRKSIIDNLSLELAHLDDELDTLDEKIAHLESQRSRLESNRSNTFSEISQLQKELDTMTEADFEAEAVEERQEELIRKRYGRWHPFMSVADWWRAALSDEETAQ